MRNRDLASDYVGRAAIRLEALDVLFNHKGWADVVREAQEVVELASRASCARTAWSRRGSTTFPKFCWQSGRGCGGLAARARALGAVSRDLRRDRELAFYGARI